MRKENIVSRAAAAAAATALVLLGGGGIHLMPAAHDN